jgi:hypothetical protein
MCAAALLEFIGTGTSESQSDIAIVRAVVAFKTMLDLFVTPFTCETGAKESNKLTSKKCGGTRTRKKLLTQKIRGFRFAVLDSIFLAGAQELEPWSYGFGGVYSRSW